MPRKSYKSKKYSKKYGYKKTKFSKFNLYSHKSAKSQAKQIYDLSKKVNTVYKMTKPDVDTLTKSLTPSTSLTFSSTSVVNYLLASIPIIDNTTLSTLGSNLDYINIRNIKFNFLYRFNDLQDTSQPIYIRLTFLKLRVGASAFPAATTVFSEQSDPYIKVRGPLHIGLYDTGIKIVGDYKFKITKDKPNLDFKTYFKGYKLDIGNTTMPKGTLVCYVYLWNPNYSGGENHAEGQAFCKIAYSNPSKTVGNA